MIFRGFGLPQKQKKKEDRDLFGIYVTKYKIIMYILFSHLHVWSINLPTRKTDLFEHFFL